MSSSYMTVSTGLSAKENLNKRWAMVEVARKEQMIHHDSGRVKMGHEHIVQSKSNH